MSHISQGSTSEKTLIVGHHYPAIDGLRGFAVLLVIWFHSSYFVTIGMEEQLGGITYGYYLLSILGETGVDLFFVLSGFLITGILIDTAHDKHVFKNFYIRRSLRIFPLYYMVTGLFLIYFFVVIGVENLDGTRALLHLFYLQNWTFEHNQDQFMLLDHTWSLAVEEQFYLLWPLVFLSFYKGSVKDVVLICLTVIAISWGLRIYLSNIEQYKWAYTFTISRMDGLALGALLSVLCARHRDAIEGAVKFLPFVILAMAAGILYLLFSQDAKMDSHHIMIKYGLILFSVLYVSLLAYVFLSQDQNLTKRIFSMTWLREVGRVSYGMYLFHTPVMMIGARILYSYELQYLQAHLILLGVGLSLTFALAFISYHLFEKRLLVLKKKYAPLKAD